MHPVGYGSDRHVGHIETWPQLLEHSAGDLAMKLRHTIGHARHAQTENGHVENVWVSALVRLLTQRQNIFHLYSRQRHCC